MKFVILLFALALAVGIVPAQPAPALLDTPPPTPSEEDQAWAVFRPALLDFQRTGDRSAFLKICKSLLAKYPNSKRYAQEWQTLIVPMEAEAVAPAPAYLTKPSDTRTPEETIRYWIYQLREVNGQQWSDPGYPELFLPESAEPTSAASQLIAIGKPAIPYLIATLTDLTPTRTIAWQRSFYRVYFILRREDLALKCLERIVGCKFYDEGATFRHFYFEEPARKQSVLDNVQAWWKVSQGDSQAQMIRNQLKLRTQNLTLENRYDELGDMSTLAMLEGPETVIQKLRVRMNAVTLDLNSPYTYLTRQLDPGMVIRDALQRFHDHKSQPGDYPTLLRYGDKAVYQELTRQYLTSGQPGARDWNGGDFLSTAARYGQNWAIPMLARGLQETTMTGSRLQGKMTEAQNFSTADIAIEEFQRLTGKDFGYLQEKSEEERLAAIARAREWWRNGGKDERQPQVEKDHPPMEPLGDMLMSDDETARRVAAITADDPATRRPAIAALGETLSYRIQRALLTALPKEPDAIVRRQMLAILAQHPQLWFLPALTTVLLQDADADTRVAASNILAGLSTASDAHLETEDAMLATARKLAADVGTPVPVRRAATRILVRWHSTVDLPLLRTLITDPIIMADDMLLNEIKSTLAQRKSAK